MKVLSTSLCCSPGRTDRTFPELSKRAPCSRPRAQTGEASEHFNLRHRSIRYFLAPAPSAASTTTASNASLVEAQKMHSLSQRLAIVRNFLKMSTSPDSVALAASTRTVCEFRTFAAETGSLRSASANDRPPLAPCAGPSPLHKSHLDAFDGPQSRRLYLETSDIPGHRAEVEATSNRTLRRAHPSKRADRASVVRESRRPAFAPTYRTKPSTRAFAKGLSDGL